MAAGHPPGTLPPSSSVPTGPQSSRHGWPTDSYGGSPHRHVPEPRSYMHSGDMPPPPPPPQPPSSSLPSGHHVAAESSTPGVKAAAGSGSSPVLSPLYVAPPKIEMQPWARNAWRWLADNTTGVARVDLRRPTPPLPEQYDGNILFVRSRQSVVKAGGRFGGRRRGGSQPAATAAAAQYTTPIYGTPYPATPYGTPYPDVQQPLVTVPSAPTGSPGLNQPLLMGARIKITRSFLIGGGKPGQKAYGSAAAAADDSAGGDPQAAATAAPAAGSPALTSAAAAAAGSQRRRRWPVWPLSWNEKPLLDIGVGVNLDVDQQHIQPVARIKVKDLVSLKAAPMGLLKVSRNIPLGPVAIKVRYELPLAHASRFWEPPARLMVRLDNAVGSGVHLTASGVEFDEQVVRFGDAVSLRASAGLSFPRQLPLQEGEPLFRLQVHRLSLRSIW